jgi:hypothetical protein
MLALVAGYVVILLACYFFEAYGIKRHHVESACFILAAIVLARTVSLKASDSPSPEAAGAHLAVAVAAILLGAAAYWRALGVGFLSDDYVLRSWVLAGHLNWVDSHLARPVALALWRVVFILGGGAASLHLVNVTLHVANTILAGRLAARLGLGRAGVLVTSIVFLLWPTQIEPVVWSAGIFDVLSTTWMLGALLICVREGPLVRTDVDVALVCALSVLALLTKESAVALPLLALIALLFLPSTGPASRRPIVMFVAVAGATAAYMCWRIWAHLPVTGTTGVTRYVVKEQLSRTFGATALPFAEQSIDAHPLLAFLIASTIVMLATASVVLADRRSRSLVITMKGLVWCVVAPLPTFGILFIGPYLDGSRYLYLAVFGWGLALGGILEAVWHRRLLREAAIVVVASICVAAGVQQQQRLTDWQGAATERDRILADATRLASEEQCGTITAGNLPTRFRGAQLFTNGFPEAMGEAWAPSTASRHCAWTWTEVGFGR